MDGFEDLARLAYAEYGLTTGNKNFQGNPMPEFDDLPETIKQAWENAAIAVWRTTIEDE